MTATDETGVVLKPGYSLYGRCVRRKFEVVRLYGCVELIHQDIEAALTSEEMTPIRENNFATLLDGKRLIWHELLVQNIHHSHRVAESND